MLFFAKNSATLKRMSDLSPIQRLHRIQVLDLELDRLRQEEGNLPTKLQEARHEQDQLNNQLEETEITLDEVEAQVRQYELDVKSIQAQISQTEAEQEKNAFDARLQVQYSGRLQQMQERVEDLEEDLEPLRQQRQELGQRSNQLRQQHRELRPQLSQLEEDDQQRIAELRQASQDSINERQELAEQMESRIIKEYNMIRKAKKGLGLTEARSGCCTACHVVLPVTIQQKISRGSMPPVKCPSCGRFLVRCELVASEKEE